MISISNFWNTWQPWSIFEPAQSPTPTPPPACEGGGESKAPLLWGEKISAEDRKAVFRVSRDLNVKPDDLMAVIACETSGSFSPSQRAFGSRNGAVGLIQFTETALRDMNQERSREGKSPLTKQGLARMSFSEQLEGPVKEYLQDHLRGIDRPNRGDLYSAVFCPAAVGKSDQAVMYRAGTDNYAANRSVDANGDCKITRGELLVRLNKWTRQVDQFARA